MNILLANFRFGEKALALTFRNMCIAISEMHSKGLLHRDLKLDNFMFRFKNSCPFTCSSEEQHIDHGFEIGLIDFGTARKLPMGQQIVDSIDLERRSHNFSFSAPEVKHQHLYSKASDVWQAGVCLWMLTFREFPVMRNLNSERLQFPDRDISPKMKELFCLLFENDPTRRITADEIIQHEWIKDHCPTPTEDIDNGNISPFSVTMSVQEEIFAQANNMCDHFDSLSVDNERVMDIEY